jgi:hypothetical protein
LGKGAEGVQPEPHRGTVAGLTLGAGGNPAITQVKRGRSFLKYSSAPHGPRGGRFDWDSRRLRSQVYS